MGTAKKLALIAAGYALAAAGGAAAVAVRESFIPPDVSAASGGMVAFGDMVFFVLAAGALGLVPTWFLLRLMLEKAPRVLLAALLLLAATGPVSWLVVVFMSEAAAAPLPQLAKDMLGLGIALAAIPRMVAGPVLLVVEAVALVLSRERLTRALLGAAMLLDLVPLTLFAAHMFRALRR